ncbi:conserved hypothetical protein [Tenacibaculum sp. 190524A02b]|uniref:Phage head morphogenesis domain-containing protein n=1 Tax=Tenacibaculum vairaonense TaxID=3137860 RepID=A0ABP1FEH8_9FLAO
MLNELTYNVGVFSFFKNHSKARQLVALLKNKDGTLKKFKDFEKEATKVIGTYNKRYLRVEHNQAVTTARAARKWQDIQRTKHLYPNLTYMVIQDGRARPLHQAWHGITLPVEHPFWRTHYPPNDWECRCYVKRSSKAIDSKGYDVENMPELPKQFGINAGIDGKIFTKEHPYFDTKEYKKVAKFAQTALITYGRKQVKEFVKQSKLIGQELTSSIGTVKLTSKALSTIVNTYHNNAYVRTNLLYDIKGVLKDAEFIKTAIDTKSNPMVKQYHYLKIEIGGEKYYLNIREYVNGDQVLFAISDKIK